VGQQLQCAVRSDDDVITVRPVGVLDFNTAPHLRSVLDKALAEAPIAIIVDMAEIEVAEGSCLTLFAAVARQPADAPPTWVLLCAASEPVASSYVELGLDRHVSVYPTCAEARRLAQSTRPIPRLSRRLAPQLDSPTLARRFASDACTEWQVAPQVTERAMLIVAELVSNVVLHAGTTMEVVLRRSARHIHIAVIDEDDRPAVLRGPQDVRSPSGRGLMLVDALAAAWGCTPTVKGKSTWAAVRYLPPPT
jgi:anti-anti-sigma factor